MDKWWIVVVETIGCTNSNRFSPRLFCPRPTRLNRWQSVWYFVENEEDDQRRFPDNGFIASHSSRAGRLPKLHLGSEPLFRGLLTPHLGCGTCVIPTRAHRAHSPLFQNRAKNCQHIFYRKQYSKLSTKFYRKQYSKLSNIVKGDTEPGSCLFDSW